MTMSALPILVDSSRRRISIDKQLGSGGEGAVYGISNDSTLVAKVYHQRPTPLAVEKLTAMVSFANPQLLSLAAWPKILVYDERTRDVAGFVMPRMQNCEPIQSLYNPLQRLKVFPKADWSFQVRVAINLAAAFDEVHKAGCLVGDVNEVNALVTSQALVRLVDCDSFQLTKNGKRYLCEVGKAHYTSPELQGKAFRGLIRTENHDRFGMAVLIYQLLFVGRHPYMGMHQDDSSFEQLIAQFRFSQGPTSRSWGMAPPPHTPIFEDIPPELGTLFRKAFERGSEGGSRPLPSDWMSILKRLEDATTKCSVESGHKYWTGAKTCVWCRIVERGGPEYWFGVAGDGKVFSFDEKKLQDVRSRIEKAQISGLDYDRQRYQLQTPCVGKLVPAEIVAMGHECHRLRVLEKLAVEKADQDSREFDTSRDRKLKVLRGKLAGEIKLFDVKLKELMAVVADERPSKDDFLNVLVTYTVSGIPLTILGLATAYSTITIGGIVLLVSGIAVLIRRFSSASPNNKLQSRARRDKSKLIVIAKRKIQQAEAILQEKKAAILLPHELNLSMLRQNLSEVVTTYEDLRNLERRNRQIRRNESDERIDKSEAAIKSHITAHNLEHHRLVTQITSLANNYQSLPDQHRIEVEALAKNSRESSLMRHMRLHSLSDAEISGVGAVRKIRLLMNGVATAADINEEVIRKIGGFGHVLIFSLLEWKRRVQQDFQFNPAIAISPTDQRALTLKYQSQQKRILSEINQQIANLESKAAACRASAARLMQGVKNAIDDFAQSDADLRVMP